MEKVSYFTQENEIEEWGEKVRRHILDPKSDVTFELPSSFLEHGKQRLALHFLQEVVRRPDYVDENVLVVIPETEKPSDAIEIQIGQGAISGMYIPYLPLKRNMAGNRVVTLSAKDFSRVREDKIIE